MNKALTLLCIGAHPDDCEIKCGGTAAKMANAGNRVVFLSVTDGRSGHHEMETGGLIVRRREEARTSAALIGAESVILGLPDGGLEPSLENRLMLIRVIREISPDLIVTNRANDYHPDHRYTSLMVQDAAYMLMVPKVAPEVPAMERNPVIMYWRDDFSKPVPFAPDIVVETDSVIETKFSMLASHESQVYEWLPWVDRFLDEVPSGRKERLAWIPEFYGRHSGHAVTAGERAILERRYGAAGSKARTIEAFELCEYGTRPDAKGLEDLFRGI